MKIRLYGNSDCYTMITLFDLYYAYKQYQNRANNYSAGIEIEFVEFDRPVDPNWLNIAWYYMPNDSTRIEYDNFDLVLFDNDHHGLEVASEVMYQGLAQKNTYLVAGAYLLDTHPYYNKVIWMPMQFVERDHYTRPMYLQYFEKLCNQTNNKNKNSIFINGENRAHRQYFLDQLTNSAWINTDVKNAWQQKIVETKDCFFETAEDSEFRTLVMELYHNIIRNAPDTYDYYNQQISIGINSKFGNKPPGYVLIDEYFEYRCVLFPETSWINDQLFITEKINKCFISKTIPWPIGGSGIHTLYNELGYQTAWNLLPKQYQQFDYEKNHVKRIDLCIQAIKWLDSNPDVLLGDSAKTIVESNYNLYHTDMLDYPGVVKLDQILTKVYNERRY